MDYNGQAQVVVAKWKLRNELAEQDIPDNAEILLTRPFSMHPDDSYLSFVMAQLLGNIATPYVTWLCNVSSGVTCYYHGNYFQDKWEAFEDWKERK